MMKYLLHKSCFFLSVATAPTKGAAYVLKDNRLHLRLPQPKYSNYALMQAINDAISLSMEEKRIEDEMARLARHNEVVPDKKDGNSGHSFSASLVCVVMCVFALFRF